MVHKSHLLKLLIIAILLVALAGCAQQAPAPTQAPAATQPPAQEKPTEAPKEVATEAPKAEEKEPVTITVWSWRSEDEDAYNEIFDVYEAANPGVTVEFVTFVNTDYNNILATGLTGEGGPDVAQLRAYGGLQPLIEAGQLVPLDGKVETLSNFTPAILKGATGIKDGRIYGVPFGIQAVAAFYNKGVFDKLGLSEPETWDDFINILETLQKEGYIPLAAPAKDTWMLPIIHDAVGAPRYGGPEFEKKVLAGETDFTDPNYVASIQVVKDLQPYMPPDVVGVGYQDSRTLFLTERAGIFIGGSFEVGYWRNEGPELELGIFRVPPPPDSLTGPLVPGWMDGSYGVNAQSDAKEEAIKLVEWMGTPEFGQMFTEKIKQLSPLPEAKPTDPLLSEFATMYAETPASYLHLVNFRYGDPSGSTLLGNGIQKMLLGEMTAEEVAQSVQEGVSQWFKPGQ
ncbi:MAG: extracellular solute-binding protein [Chloroflexi bacterium]|nr:extracellular solute-binding protein [Chloroflexota bacterium]